jgi:hypothetical protein
MNFEGFSTIEFPPINRETPGFVYVWFLISESGEVPFYVGRTTRIWGRLDDYYWAMFSAPTDFRVGEAIRHLGRSGYRVIVKYKASADPAKEEAEIIKDLRGSGRILLNQGLDCAKADKSKQLVEVQKFIDRLLLIGRST